MYKIFTLVCLFTCRSLHTPYPCTSVEVSPAVSPSPQGQSPSPSPSGQSPSPSGVSPSPLDRSNQPSYMPPNLPRALARAQFLVLFYFVF